MGGGRRIGIGKVEDGRRHHCFCASLILVLFEYFAAFSVMAGLDGTAQEFSYTLLTCYDHWANPGDRCASLAGISFGFRFVKGLSKIIWQARSSKHLWPNQLFDLKHGSLVNYRKKSESESPPSPPPPIGATNGTLAVAAAFGIGIVGCGCGRAIGDCCSGGAGFILIWLIAVGIVASRFDADGRSSSEEEEEEERLNWRGFFRT
jgi:hypothetical protein